MKFDNRKLWGKIRESGMNADEVAKKIGIARSSFSDKINGKRDFTQTEIKLLVMVLGIDNVHDTFLLPAAE